MRQRLAYLSSWLSHDGERSPSLESCLWALKQMSALQLEPLNLTHCLANEPKHYVTYPTLASLWYAPQQRLQQQVLEDTKKGLTGLQVEMET